MYTPHHSARPRARDGRAAKYARDGAFGRDGIWPSGTGTSGVLRRDAGGRGLSDRVKDTPLTYDNDFLAMLAPWTRVDFG